MSGKTLSLDGVLYELEKLDIQAIQAAISRNFAVIDFILSCKPDEWKHGLKIDLLTRGSFHIDTHTANNLLHEKIYENFALESVLEKVVKANRMTR